MQQANMEERQMDAGMEAIIQRVRDIKKNLLNLILKLEHDHENLTWPQMLNSYALISSQISMLHKFLKNDKLKAMRNYVPLPSTLSPNVDPILQEMTEGRVMFFNHDIVPSHLRTKPEQEVEERLSQLQTKTQSISPDNLNKHINTLNKLSNIVQECLKNYRDHFDFDHNQKSLSYQPTTTEDTNNLVASLIAGKGLNPPSQRPSSSNQQNMNTDKPQPVKATLKSNIPYNR